jgi:hypothetical protein
MAIQTRTLVGAAGVFLVAAVAVWFTTLMPVPQDNAQVGANTQRGWSVEITDAEE